jgi:outer membrane protein TolC
LGGGPVGGQYRFGESEDYAAFLFWRIGPGGLLDFGRAHQAQSQLDTTRLVGMKLKDAVVREVVEAFTRCNSLSDQLDAARKNMETATEAEKLAEQRHEFGVGAVLEDIQTQKDLTAARNDYVGVVAEYNKAQYALERAVGKALNPK